MDDIDDELRKLFNDDRLDVHVTPDATSSVVRGAQRRRRRRAAATGTFAVVAVIGAGIGLTQLRPLALDSADDLLPTSSSTASTTPPPPSVSTYTQTVTVTVDPPVGGVPNTAQNGTTAPNTTKSSSTSTTKESAPGVFGRLALGMSEEDALKTGSLGTAGTPTEAGCKPYSSVSNADPSTVLISSAKGIVRIKLPDTARTSKNIGTGSKVTDLKNAYPSAAVNGSELVVQMTATPAWVYVFENDGTAVTSVRMRLADNDCPGA
ncbi:hypothetical protein SAMN05216553_12271 [Lentzea fradiae]|uniref:Uncharacterized protein n=1 Tax=Lentzea fradiae TaxID=200378 RepID=A0A1G8CHI3_9PSEU|nr:hypothetical protein [Lentzea fradiae]SDH44693.1 hypothetical protein SAMN05216553_12271 [Lentzea fradiae]